MFQAFSSAVGKGTALRSGLSSNCLMPPLISISEAQDVHKHLSLNERSIRLREVGPHLQLHTFPKSNLTRVELVIAESSSSLDFGGAGCVGVAVPPDPGGARAAIVPPTAPLCNWHHYILQPPFNFRDVNTFDRDVNCRKMLDKETQLAPLSLGHRPGLDCS